MTMPPILSTSGSETELATTKPMRKGSRLKGARRKVANKAKQQIHIWVEVSGSNETERIDLIVENRRALNEILFKDTRGRTRLAIEGEPLLSNMSDPAIVHTDGEVEYYVNGHQTDLGSLPYGEKFELEYDATGSADMLCFEEEGYEEVVFEPGLCEVVPVCDEEGHGWLVSMASSNDDDPRIIELLVDMEDIDYMALIDNELDLDPADFFHSMRFGHELMMIISHWDVDNRGFLEYLTEEGSDNVFDEFKRQLGMKKIGISDEEILDAIIEQEKPVATEESSGFGTAVFAGMATMAAAGALHVLTKGKSVKKLAAPVKAEVRV